MTTATHVSTTEAKMPRTSLAAFESDLKLSSRISLPLIDGRESLLQELATSSECVAHIGCADAPYTEERISKSLHARLLSANPRAVGIDIDERGIEALRALRPDSEFRVADVTQAIPAEMRSQFDLVIAGEVLEHVNDAGMFLEGCKSLLAPGGQLCLTVPNACNPLIGVRSLLGREIVNPDHVAYYSPRTLLSLTERHGFQTTSLVTCFREPPPSSRARVFRVLMKRAHRVFGGPVGDGLIWVGRPSENGDGTGTSEGA
jgi:2-polyprenyl-3-methyl-5-hydroxy-6-metoxy-1,4-benzoquinol methylase